MENASIAAVERSGYSPLNDEVIATFMITIVRFASNRGFRS